MEWFERMGNALDYIEAHMLEDVDVSMVARIACSSPVHFQRMFSVITGVTLMDYVRRRRLTLAAQELAMDSTAKVIDTALRYGYETPEAFAKAFKRVHGTAPTGVRDRGVTLRAFPRITFSISLKGDIPMDYKLVELPGFQVIGRGIRVTTKDGENSRRIPEFWTECHRDDTCARLDTLSPDGETLGLCLDMDFAAEEFTYMVAVRHKGGDIPEGFELREVPGSLWAVFTSIGPMPKAIQDVTNRIFQEWFPATGFEHANLPELEVYPMGDLNAADYRCEVWIPIVKKG